MAAVRRSAHSHHSNGPYGSAHHSRSGSHQLSDGCGGNSSGLSSHRRSGANSDTNGMPEPRLPREEEELPEEDVGTANLQVILVACAGRGGRLGLAYVDLDAAERVLHVADVLDLEFAQLQRLKQVLLTGSGSCHGLCAVPAKASAELLRVAAEPLHLSQDGQEPEPFPVAVLKAGDFDFEQCRQRLLLLRVEGEEEDARSNENPAARCVRGQGRLDLDNDQLVRAAGGLARFLERNRAHLGDLDDAQALSIHSIRLFSPESLLCVDGQTMAALQVFCEDHHPSLIRGMGRTKEGVSLFGLLEPLVASAAGRTTLRRWLQQPSRDAKLLQERHDAIEELVRPRHQELLRAVHRELREVRDIPALLTRVFGCFQFENVHDWRSLMTTLEHMSATFALVQADVLGTALAPLHDAGALAVDIAAVGDMLGRVIDLEASTNSGEVKVRAGVDRKLDEVRDQYEQIDVYLTEVAQLERRRLRELGVAGMTDALTFHYFPQLGFHASVLNPLTQDGEENAAMMEEVKRRLPLPAEDWSYQFAGGGRLFYKCPLANRLDAEIGDLVVAVRELELELLLGVVERLRRFEPRLCRTAQLLADFDVLVALSVAATQLNWRRPQISQDPRCLRIVKGRHPLVEASLSTHHGFVPNDTALGTANASGGDAAQNRSENSACRVQVITGANLAGKSVYLKQVGLIVLLAQVGSFVPAEEAEIGLCDFLFSRIQSCESAAVRCSAFGIDLTQVARALRHATSASLVLLDEFGKGTHAADGVALFGAVVQHLSRWKEGPKAIVTTHFTEVFRFGFIPMEAPGLQLSSMRVLPPEDQGHGVAYLYQLVPGVTDRSFGIECAKKAGLDADVVVRAAEILAALEQGLAVPPPRSGPSAEAAERAKVRGEEQRFDAYRLVVNQLESIDPDDPQACRALLGFVWSQQGLIRDGLS